MDIFRNLNRFPFVSEHLPMARNATARMGRVNFMFDEFGEEGMRRSMPEKVVRLGTMMRVIQSYFIHAMQWHAPSFPILGRRVGGPKVRDMLESPKSVHRETSCPSMEETRRLSASALSMIRASFLWPGSTTMFRSRRICVTSGDTASTFAGRRRAIQPETKNQRGLIGSCGGVLWRRYHALDCFQDERYVTEEAVRAEFNKIFDTVDGDRGVGYLDNERHFGDGVNLRQKLCSFFAVSKKEVWTRRDQAAYLARNDNMASQSSLTLYVFPSRRLVINAFKMHHRASRNVALTQSANALMLQPEAPVTKHIPHEHITPEVCRDRLPAGDEIAPQNVRRQRVRGQAGSATVPGWALLRHHVTTEESIPRIFARIAAIHDEIVETCLYVLVPPMTEQKRKVEHGTGAPTAAGELDRPVRSPPSELITSVGTNDLLAVFMIAVEESTLGRALSHQNGIRWGAEMGKNAVRADGGHLFDGSIRVEAGETVKDGRQDAVVTVGIKPLLRAGGMKGLGLALVHSGNNGNLQAGADER
ncbi:hypothetical protein BDK51DRAFT_38053 [Blyttiomyces helicus]|uniref:Uncharacterized protein n=1 Tax=Blyttiomyces helicus TaxID=388810 RepID=A0A4P9WMN1_9FUNG|nr:hypothetical protein BDK51DRAFT_38053 [Blyttiomyces helicus]|eukprot:RKO92440.1 hypothetical protein BDK51DRAFT_38053 [Blyttiomyces helicus]